MNDDIGIRVATHTRDHGNVLAGDIDPSGRREKVWGDECDFKFHFFLVSEDIQSEFITNLVAVEESREFGAESEFFAVDGLDNVAGEKTRFLGRAVFLSGGDGEAGLKLF